MNTAVWCFLILLSGPALAASGQTPAPTRTVSRIVGGLSSSETALGRLAALRRLPDVLPEADARALGDYVGSARPEGFSPPVWHALVNDAWDLLLRQRPLPSGLCRRLIDAARANDDPVLRDYAVQKLPDPIMAGAMPAGLRDDAMNLLAETAQANGPFIQGTALLAWRRIAAATGGRDERLEWAILNCLNSPKASVPARVSALQAGALMRCPGVAEAARAILSAPARPAVLQAGALSALGTLGNQKTDTPLIAGFLNHPVCATAAARALSQLSNP